MKLNFLLPAIILAIVSGCSTSYKTGQTPDDVYYSPARLQNVQVRNEKEIEKDVYYTTEDREYRRRINNRHFRRYDDRYDRNSYPYGYDNGYYNNYPRVYGNPKYGTTPNNSQPRKINLGAYSTNATPPDSSGAYNPKFGRQNNGTNNNPVRTFGNPTNSSSNNGSGFGNMIRRVFSGSNTSNNTYTPGTSGNYDNSSPSRTFDTRSSNNSSNNNNNNSSSNNTKSTTTESKTSSTPVRKF